MSVPLAWVEPVDRADAETRKSKAAAQYAETCTELGSLPRTPDHAERRARLLRRQDLIREEISKLKAWITKQCAEGRRILGGAGGGHRDLLIDAIILIEDMLAELPEDCPLLERAESLLDRTEYLVAPAIVDAAREDAGLPQRSQSSAGSTSDR